MSKCKYHEICGLLDEADPEHGLCILHSRNLEKDRMAFSDALAKLRTHRMGDNYAQVVFPIPAEFAGYKFERGANFEGATFAKGAYFDEALFLGDTYFSRTNFSVKADFSGAKFAEKVTFAQATFNQEAVFFRAAFEKDAIFFETVFTSGALFLQSRFAMEVVFRAARFGGTTSFALTTFAGQANFDLATFAGDANFLEAKFLCGAGFMATLFEGKEADFRLSHFGGKTIFSSGIRDGKSLSIFSNVEVDFRHVSIDPLDAIAFRDADLTKCRFRDTDLRRVELTGVRWPQIRGRSRVYDEIAPLDRDMAFEWPRIERLYRELKQNYEDRRDYERGGDFHIGEKEIRLRNPDTRIDLRFVLALYKLVSGYGENYRRTVCWVMALIFLTAAITLLDGLTMVVGTKSRTLSPASLCDWGWALLYGLEAAVHLPAREFVTETGRGRVLSTISSTLGPILIALFGLALRQRLKR